MVKPNKKWDLVSLACGKSSSETITTNKICCNATITDGKETKNCGANLNVKGDQAHTHTMCVNQPRKK